VNSSSSRAELHRQLERGFVLAPGIYNAMFGKLVEEIGFSCAYMTGFGTAARYECADVGLITQSEMAANVRAICPVTRLDRAHRCARRELGTPRRPGTLHLIEQPRCRAPPRAPYQARCRAAEGSA
jgi:hypothetical protein